METPYNFEHKKGHMTKVWVVIKGMYSDQKVEAVYSNVEDALRAYPEGVWEQGDTDDGDADWLSKAGLSDFHSITSYIIDEHGKVRQKREQEEWLTKYPEFR